MALSDVIKKMDEADAEIREQVKQPGVPLGERAALERARDLLQQALTPLLRYSM